MSSKSIFTILSYTVSKFVRFFLRHSVHVNVANRRGPDRQHNDVATSHVALGASR